MKNLFQRLYLRYLYSKLKGEQKPSFEAFYYAMQGYSKLKSDLGNTNYLTIVDLTKSNQSIRFFVLDMQACKVNFCSQTGHGKKSGGEFATQFSNENGSNQTSLGFYRTPLQIQKARTKNRSGLLLSGIEKSNDNARLRGIFIHPAGIDQSEGCFTLPMPQEQANVIMEKIQGDSLLFAYYPDKNYLSESKLLTKI